MAEMQYAGNIRSAPEWAGDFGGREHILPTPARIDPTQFTNQLGVNVTLTQNVAGAGTVLTVSALALASSSANALISAGNVVIPAGAAIAFGGAKFARVTTAAQLGATTIAVAALPTALVIGDTGTYNVLGSGKFVPSGTFVGRTFTERDAGTGFGPAADGDDEQFLLYNDIADADRNPDCELYRHGSLVKENYLPNYTTLNTAANEVQNVVFGGTASGGTFKIGVTMPSGAVVWTDTIAWNATNGTIISNINTALDSTFGSSAIVAADNSGSAANPNFNLTFSGTGYASLGQSLVAIDPAALTGATTATVSRTTAGGKANLTRIRARYRCIKGTD
jgi:hypothetical protein